MLPNARVRSLGPARIAAAARGLIVAGAALCLASLLIPWRDCLHCDAAFQASFRSSLYGRLREGFTGSHAALIIAAIVAAAVTMMLVGMFAGPRILALYTWLFVAGVAEGLRIYSGLTYDPYYLLWRAGRESTSGIPTRIGPTVAYTGVWLVFMGAAAVVLFALVSWALARRRHLAPATAAPSSAGRR